MSSIFKQADLPEPAKSLAAYNLMSSTCLEVFINGMFREKVRITEITTWKIFDWSTQGIVMFLPENDLDLLLECKNGDEYLFSCGMLGGT